MKLGVVAVLMVLGGLPLCHASLRRHATSKNPYPKNSMATNLKEAATESFLRTHLATDEKEIARQKERADSQEKLVEVLASRLDLEERRMARAIMRINELEKKVNGTTKPASQEMPAMQDKAEVQDSQASRAVQASNNTSTRATQVKLTHSEIPVTAAKALESKHTPVAGSPKQVPQQSNASDVGGDVIPEADTLTAVDTAGLDAADKSDDAELENDDHDDVAQALEKEELSEDSPSDKTAVAKTAVVRLAHRSVPAVSSSEDLPPVAEVSTSHPARPARVDAVPPQSKVSITTTTSTTTMDRIPPPPPPLADDDNEVKDSAPLTEPQVSTPSVEKANAKKVDSAPASPGVLGAPPVQPPPPPPTKQVDDVDMSTDSLSADATDSEDTDTTDKADEAAEDEIQKDDEALAASSSSTDKDLDSTDAEIDSEEKEIDTEEAAVEESDSTSSTSELDDEAV